MVKCKNICDIALDANQYWRHDVNDNESWKLNRERGVQTLEEAKRLLELRFHDVACVRALGSCIQIARSVAGQLVNDRDDRNWRDRLPMMFRDGRLPHELRKPYGELMRAHDQHLAAKQPADAVRAASTIETVALFHRAMLSAADLTASLQSPELRAAAKAKKIPLPANPFRP
jgi:hypothetical protein